MEIGSSNEMGPDRLVRPGCMASRKIKAEKDLGVIKERIKNGYYIRPDVINATIDILLGRPEFIEALND